MEEFYFNKSDYNQKKMFFFIWFIKCCIQLKIKKKKKSF